MIGLQYILFDVETTGLTKCDEVIQFSCIFLKDQFRSCNDLADFYCMTTQQISPKALEVHHITLNKLYTLSNGTFFEENFYKLAKQFEKDCTFVYFSNSNFDTRLVNQTLSNANLPCYQFGDRVSTLKPMKGRHCFDLQSAVARYYHVPGGRVSLRRAVDYVTDGHPELITQKYVNLNKKLEAIGKGCPENSELFHNARFDTFCMWYILAKIGDSFRL